MGPAHLLLSLISLLLLWVFLSGCSSRGRIPPFLTSDSSQICAGWLLCLVLHGCLALSCLPWVPVGLLVVPVECSGIKEVASIEAEEWQPSSAEGSLDNLMEEGWDVFSLSL